MQDLLGVLAKGGNSIDALHPIRRIRRAQEARNRAYWSLNIPPSVPFPQLSVTDQIRDRVVAGVSDAGGVSEGLDLLKGMPCRPLGDGPIYLVASGAPAPIGGESWILTEIRTLDHLQAQSVPFAVVGGPQHHR
jgi:hypothetical protein